MVGPGKRRCYGCIQARSSLPARFLILKAGQELRQELDLSLFPETDLTNLRKYCICLLHWYVYLYMVTGHYQLLMSRVSSRSGDASSEFPTSHTFAHMCVQRQRCLNVHRPKTCTRWRGVLVHAWDSHVSRVRLLIVITDGSRTKSYIHTYTLTPFFHVFMSNILHLHTLHCKVGMANMKQTNCS